MKQWEVTYWRSDGLRIRMYAADTMDELCKLIALDLSEDLIVKIEQVPVCGH